MKKIHVFGAVDKTSLLLTMSKTIAAMGKKLLLVDDTLRALYRYCVPKLDEQDKLVEYDGFDILSDCNSWDEALEIINNQNEKIERYDYVLIDSDNQLNVAGWGPADKHILLYNFERPTQAMNKEILTAFFQEKQTELLPIIKINYPFLKCHVDENFIRGEYDSLPIAWEKGDSFEIDFDEMEYRLKINNQYETKLKLKGISNHTKNTVIDVLEQITGEQRKEILAAFKRAQKNIKSKENAS